MPSKRQRVIEVTVKVLVNEWEQADLYQYATAAWLGINSCNPPSWIVSKTAKDIGWQDIDLD